MAKSVHLHLRDDAISPFDGVMLRILVSVGIAAADTLFFQGRSYEHRSYSGSWKPGMNAGRR